MNAPLNLNIEKSLEILLGEKYVSEFEVIDGLNQHPQGINFYQWLLKKNLISKSTLAKIQIELNIETERERREELGLCPFCGNEDCQSDHK